MGGWVSDRRICRHHCNHSMAGPWEVSMTETETTEQCPECACRNGWHEGRCSIGLAEVDRVAAERLQTILADIVQRPLTPEEIARTHQHVVTISTVFDASMKDAP